MRESYNGENEEPEYLTCKYPHVLVNSSPGIGYGVSFGIPPYNFTEVCDLTINLIKDPSYKNCVLIPDCPTRCQVIDNGQFEDICKDGNGKFTMRGEVVIDEEKNIIKIVSVPYTVDTTVIKKSIIYLHDEKIINGITKIDDCTKYDTADLRIYLKKEVDPHSILPIIYKRTSLEKTIPIQFKLIDDYQDVNLNLRSLILEWVNNRRYIKRRFYNQRLSKLHHRQHLLEILIFILNKDNAETTMGIVKKSENRKEIIQKLIIKYKISSLQAETIADMKIYQFSKESYKKYIDEKEEIADKIKFINKLLSNPMDIDDIIVDELKEGIKLFGFKRRSKIIKVDNENYVRNTDHLLLFTEKGFVKKLPIDIPNVGDLANEDKILEIITINNRENILVFDELGKITKIPVNDIPSHVLTSDGTKISKYGNINGKIVSLLKKPEKDKTDTSEPKYFIFITENGIIKKTLADKYINIKPSLISLILKENDRLVQVKVAKKDSDMLIYTRKGLGIRFNLSDVRDTNRVTTGVSAFKLEEDDKVIGLDILSNEDKYLMVLTNRGAGKKCTLSNFKTTSRNSDLLRIISLDDDEDISLARTIKGTEIFNVYTKNNIIQLDVNDLVELPRMSRGRKILSLGKSNYIVDVRLKNIK
jgi:DNA gyrase subunit A